jgi:hypothetical protein
MRLVVPPNIVETCTQKYFEIINLKISNDDKIEQLKTLWGDSFLYCEHLTKRILRSIDELENRTIPLDLHESNVIQFEKI